MPLTTAQLATLKAAIDADPILSAQPNNSDGASNIAFALNQPTAAFWVYRTVVSNEEIGDAMNGSEIAGLASLGMQRLQVLAAYSGGSQNGSRFDRRDAFDRVFSGAGGAITRAALAVVWRRLATRFEQIFATGTGTTGSPGTLVVEGPLSFQEVVAARG